MSLNLMDLTRAWSNRLATSRALRRVAPRGLIYGTAGAALLEPGSRLGSAAVRFDALAADNRPGARHLFQRLLERRMIARAAVLLPWSGPSTWPELARRHARGPIALPTPVEPFAPSQFREPTAVCYGGAPEKKRLDLLIGAWHEAALGEPYRLVVTGLDAAAGRRWLKRRGIAEPAGVSWSGKLAPDAYRELTSRASFYLSASRYEDYGIAQLEALADGALLVTAPAQGPYEALALARSLHPGLVAGDLAVEPLARALRAAAELPEAEREAYRMRAAALLAPYSRATFRERLAREVLPIVLHREAAASGQGR
jgi:glycosyltransferase involved in cell wall biosynthesis